MKTETRSDLERTAEFLMRAEGLPEWVREYKPLEDRKFRIDFAWPSPHKVGLEVEGGAFVGGRHVQGGGFEKDAEKYSLLAAEGWLIIRATRRHLESLAFIGWVKRALELRS